MALPEGEINLKSNRITQKFRSLKEKGQKGLITFITAGDPDMDITVKLVLAMEQSGADIIELGVPYSDPLADGPVIQQASLRSLKNGTNLNKIFAAVREIRKQSAIPLLLMTYYNPVLKFGLQDFALEAAAAGVDGLIVPDLPAEESGPLTRALEADAIQLIPLIAPTSGEDRMRVITKGEKGFVYCVSVTGVTGIREGVPEGLEDFLAIARRATDNPLAVGFGVSGPQQAQEIAKYCDAVIVGSALVKTIEDNQKSTDLVERVGQFIKGLKAAL